MSSVSIKTQPTSLPVSLEEAKIFSRIIQTREDSQILGFIQAATDYAEDITGRAIMPQTIIFYLDQFPVTREIELPKPKLRSVTEIRYYDENDEQQTLSSANYEVDIYSLIGKVALVDGESWPTTKRKINAIEVEYEAGYASASKVPEGLKTAIKLEVSTNFEFRQNMLTSFGGAYGVIEVPRTTAHILRRYQVKVKY